MVSEPSFFEPSDVIEPDEVYWLNLTGTKVLSLSET